MPVQLKWHPSLPILIVTYPASLSREAYHAMSDQRQAMLDARPEHDVIVLVDVRGLFTFTDPQVIEQCDSALAHPRVRRIAIVLDGDLYDGMVRAFLPPDVLFEHRVDFFKDYDVALNAATAWLRDRGD